MNLNDFSKNILCPADRVCYPKEVKHTFGHVVNAENLLSGNEKTTKLKYDTETAPKIIFDLGESSVGGYPVFKVKSYKGKKPVIRLAYSDWYDYMMEEPYGEQGDFRRGCCKYLGVELPVLPGDPNRFNLFTVSHPGLYLSPLVQGQQRWLMIKLDTPDTEVELEFAYIYYTSDASAYDGAFDCSDPLLTKLWYASVWTCQIATIDNSHSWDTLCNTLLLRALAKGQDAGIYKAGTHWSDYTATAVVAIARNPQMCSGVGLLVRATTLQDGYVVFLNLDRTVQAYVRANGTYHLLKQAVLDEEVLDNHDYTLSITASGNQFFVSLNGNEVLSFADSTYSRGTVGFCQTTEKWATANLLKVESNGSILLEDHFDKGLNAYDFTRSAPFISDGAKRDRLPWIGDLDWAGRNVYYAFRHFSAMAESLRMFAFHQTPEGYVWGTCYPENKQKPGIGDYGYYESDIFSAWIVPTLADYLLFTDDKKFCEEIYRNIVDDVDYLWRFVEADGLFNQRYATSKGLWDHVLNDMGKFTYNNLIISEAFGEAAYIARTLGKADDAAEFERRKATVRKAIRENFTSPEGYLTKSLTNRDMCEMANSLALSIHYFDNREHAKAALDALLARTPGHGKIVALMIRGAYMYDFDEEAMRTMIQPGYRYVEENTDFIVYDALENPNFDFASHHMHPANWLKSLQDQRGPATTWECMTYPPLKESKGDAWGDRSHPDTAIAHILTGYCLGVLPVEAGFKSFAVEPHTFGLQNAKGIIPSAYGNIEVEWNKNGNDFTLNINHEQTLDHVRIAKEDGNARVFVNGKALQKQNEDANYIYFG